MRKVFIIIAAAIAVSGSAQQIQWASKVIKYSSDLGGKQNGIKRILGKPDAFPQGGPSANAWTPKNALDGWETVVVGFDKPQTVRQVAVFENLNAGCVNRIMADDGSGKFQTVWYRKPEHRTPLYSPTIAADRRYYYNRKRRRVQTAPDVAVNSGIEYAILDAPVANVVAIKVEFIFASLPGQKQIDAIGISDSPEPILPTINLVSGLESLPDAKPLPFDRLQPSAPVVSADGQKLFFTSNAGEKEVIYSCSLTNGEWSAPVSEDASLSSNRNFNYIESYGHYILKGGVAYGRGTGETGYEFLQMRDGKYQSVGPLKITAYNNYDDTSEATITADGKVIIIGIESDLSQGGADLYFATRKEDGTYMFLQNMGKIINSAADESMPFLLSDQKTLLFSSNGFSSYGDYDIYVTSRLDDTWKNWSEPKNLGSKINSGSFDGAPFYDEKDGQLYFTRAGDGTTSIYRIAVPVAMLQAD
ncbi:MAG TPA: hypothetical protein VF676_06015 [Flavobacterium sp.]|jgi:hypothetical protein